MIRSRGGGGEDIADCPLRPRMHNLPRPAAAGPQRALRIASMPQYFSQLGEDCLLAQFFGFKTSGFFIDVGAFDGIYLTNTFFFGGLGWSGVGVGAFPPYFNLCVR